MTEQTIGEYRAEYERRQARPTVNPFTAAGVSEADRERQIVRAAMRGPRDLKNAWDAQASAGFDTEPAEVDHARLKASLAHSAQAMDRMVERAQSATRSDRVTPRPGSVPARGGWETLIERAHAEQAHAVIGGADPGVRYAVDPEELEDERLRREGAQVIARHGHGRKGTSDEQQTGN